VYGDHDPRTSKMTDEVLAQIGAKIGPFPVTVNADDIADVRDILGDDNPAYDEAGIAPPYAIGHLLPEQTRSQVYPRVMRRQFANQCSWTFEEPLRIGDQLSATCEIIDIRERMGDMLGHMIYFLVQTTFTNADGQVVCTEVMNLAQFDGFR